MFVRGKEYKGQEEVFIGQEPKKWEMQFACVVPADSSSSIPADNVPAGSSSSIPADYVSAGHMEYWIQNADHNLWRIVQQGNSPKRLGKDAKGNTIVHPPVSLDEHVAVQRRIRTKTIEEEPCSTTILQNTSVTEEEGLHKGYDRFQKILSQLNQVQARPDNDDINLKFLRALPSSWSQVALALKTRGGLESMSFDDLYNKLEGHLNLMSELVKSYCGESLLLSSLTHSAFIGSANSGSNLITLINRDCSTDSSTSARS
ncbi:hypothetical protein Tco_0458042 [Tanacetum coccineum]